MVGLEEWDQDYEHSKTTPGMGLYKKQWKTCGMYVREDNVRYGTELLSPGKSNGTFEGVPIW